MWIRIRIWIRIRNTGENRFMFIVSQLQGTVHYVGWVSNKHGQGFYWEDEVSLSTGTYSRIFGINRKL
jgi:hypothetical protein